MDGSKEYIQGQCSQNGGNWKQETHTRGLFSKWGKVMSGVQLSSVSGPLLLDHSE